MQALEQMVGIRTRTVAVVSSMTKMDVQVWEQSTMRFIFQRPILYVPWKVVFVWNNVAMYHGSGTPILILSTFAELLTTSDDDTKDLQKQVDGPQLRLGTEWRLRHT